MKPDVHHIGTMARFVAERQAVNRSAAALAKVEGNLEELGYGA